MPLMHKESQKAFKHNVKEEMEAHPSKRAQNLAIAYAIKRKAEKEHEAHGGEMHMCSGGGCEHPSHYAEGGKVQKDYSGGQKRGPEGYPKYQEQAQNERGVHTPVSGVTAFPHGKGTSQAGDYTKERYAGKPLFSGDKHPAKKEHERVLSEMKSMPKPKLMAEGGEAPIKGHGRLGVEFDPTLPPRKGYPKNAAEQYENLKSEHARVSEMSKRDRAMKAFNGKKMAEGGMMTNDGYQSEKKPDVDGDLMPEAHKRAELQEHVEHMDAPDSSVEHAEMNQEGDEDEGAGGGDEIDPFVMKIMMGRAKGYSKGGQVANEDSGESSSDSEELAKSESNEFDELGKSGGMDAQYHGSEEIGDEQEDEDRDDIVSRVMKSRSKRDRMAVSGEGSTYGRGR